MAKYNEYAYAIEEELLEKRKNNGKPKVYVKKRKSIIIEDISPTSQIEINDGFSSSSYCSPKSGEYDDFE
jgi:hypothetical protein